MENEPVRNEEPTPTPAPDAQVLPETPAEPPSAYQFNAAQREIIDDKDAALRIVKIRLAERHMNVVGLKAQLAEAEQAEAREAASVRQLTEDLNNQVTAFVRKFGVDLTDPNAGAWSLNIEKGILFRVR